MKARRLKRLKIRRVDLVARGANPGADVVLFKAEWTQAQINDLPDSSFAIIEPGGEKDPAGKTVPRSLRHLPFKGPDGKVDLAHLRNALARLSQSDLSEDLKSKARAKLQAAAREAGVGEAAEKSDDGHNTNETYCSKCGKPFEKAAEEKVMADNTEQIQKLQADLEAANSKNAEIEKAMRERDESVAELKKSLDEATEKIRKAEDEAKLAEFKKAVDAFEHLPVKADVFGPILKTCAEALGEEGYAELMRVLKAGDAAPADKFVEKGVPGGQEELKGDSAIKELDNKIEELVKAGGITKAEATVQVCKQNPKLYDRARREGYSARDDKE